MFHVPMDVTWENEKLIKSLVFRQCLEITQNIASPEASELAKLLSQYESEGMFWAHDTIAQEVLPQDETTATEVTVTLPAEEPSMYNNADQHPANITIINIEKTNEPLVSRNL